MIIKFYNISLNNNLIKDIRTETEKDISLPAKIDLHSFELKMNNDFSFNYCYIPQFKRYYFVDIVSIENESVRIKLDCDYLMTFFETIIENFYIANEIEVTGRLVKATLKNLSGQYVNGLNVTYIETKKIPSECDVSWRDVSAIKNIFQTGLIFLNFREVD